MIDISAGAWRRHVWPDQAAWPAVDPAQERRKYLACAGGRRWLLKFAGLGAIGVRKLAHARALHAAGWGAEPLGLAHGFLIEEWHEDRRPAPPRPTEIAHYLAARARLPPTDRLQGANLFELQTMSRHNVELALGSALAARLDRWTPRLPRLATRVVPMETDGRLDRHEWLRLADGRLLKADALDHHAGHDLIGCQDIAWDVAGAIVELGLAPLAAHALTTAVGACIGRPVDPELTEFLAAAYLAFRLGQTTLAAEGAGASPDAVRLQARMQAYARRLEQELCRAA